MYMHDDKRWLVNIPAVSAVQNLPIVSLCRAFLALVMLHEYLQLGLTTCNRVTQQHAPLLLLTIAFNPLQLAAALASNYNAAVSVHACSLLRLQTGTCLLLIAHEPCNLLCICVRTPHQVVLLLTVRQERHTSPQSCSFCCSMLSLCCYELLSRNDASPQSCSFCCSMLTLDSLMSLKPYSVSVGAHATSLCCYELLGRNAASLQSYHCCSCMLPLHSLMLSAFPAGSDLLPAKLSTNLWRSPFHPPAHPTQAHARAPPRPHTARLATRGRRIGCQGSFRCTVHFANHRPSC